jgi:hypothetical protein
MSGEAGGKDYTLNADTGTFNASGSLGVDLQVLTYPQRLLTLAQRLIDEGEYSVSIVVSHIACEIATDRSFTEAFRARGIEDLEEPIEKLFSGNNLGNDKTRKLYTALTGDEIQNQPFWQRFTDSAKRRNSISHNGVAYEQTEADQSLAVAKAFVAHLGQ